MSNIHPPGQQDDTCTKLRETRAVSEPPTSMALWPTFMRRTIVADAAQPRRGEDCREERAGYRDWEG